MIKQLSKIAIAFAMLGIVFSCSTIKKLPAKVAGGARSRFVGTWALNNVSYDGLVAGAVQGVFNQGPPEDFNGSTWNLTNSGNGTYTLASGASQKIFWSYSNTNGEIFQFKQLFEGDKARKVQEGFQLIVAQINDTQMVLKSPVAVGDKTAYVVFSFNKTK